MKAKRLLKKLNYLPRWAWYALSFFTFGPFGVVGVYLAFYALNKMAAEEREEETSDFAWRVDVDDSGVHVHKGRARRSAARAAGVYQDEECTVTGEEDVETKWQQTAASARRAQPQSKASKPAQEPISENATVDDVIAEGQSAMVRIRYANDLIPDPELSAQIDSIENSCGQILSILEQRPQLLPQLRTFLRYYLPTTLHLLDARAKLENTASTPKAREVRQRISEALGVVDKAFRKQVEALDEYRFIDLESEMDVLRDMLRADGLLEEEEEDDPFAEVLAQRKENKGQTMGGH